MKENYNYKKRMLDEIIELTKKIELLGRFCESNLAKTPNEAELLERQLVAMKEYFCALLDRIYLELE